MSNWSAVEAGFRAAWFRRLSVTAAVVLMLAVMAVRVDVSIAIGGGVEAR